MTHFETSPEANRKSRMAKIAAGATETYEKFMESMLNGDTNRWDGVFASPEVTQPKSLDQNLQPPEARATPLVASQNNKPPYVAG